MDAVITGEAPRATRARPGATGERAGAIGEMTGTTGSGTGAARDAADARVWSEQAQAAATGLRRRRAATTVGALFIIGDIAGVLSYAVTGGLLDGPTALTKVAANQSHLALGALFILIMGLALAMIPVITYPIFKKYNEVLALGTLVFRGALETVAYMACAGLWLALLELSRGPTAVASAGAPHVQTLTGLLTTTQGSVAGWLTAIVFSLGALMFYALFYQSRLVPRWLSVWGLVGAVLYLAWPLFGMFGHGFGLLMAPLAVAELVLAVWLIVKGFAAPGREEASA